MIHKSLYKASECMQFTHESFDNEQQRKCFSRIQENKETQYLFENCSTPTGNELLSSYVLLDGCHRVQILLIFNLSIFVCYLL